jgi:dethiobiotin synthase
VAEIVFVVGTGTDVGKTHVTRALSLAARAPAWKPVTSGGLDDVVRLEAAPPMFALSEPLSPHLAARIDGVVIDASAIAREAIERAKAHERYLVESAGGLYSPVSVRETNADIARAFGAAAKLLLVAPDRIGVLHDVGATLRAARGDGLTVAGIVLSAPAVPDRSTGTNAEELVKLGLARTVVTFPRAGAEAPETRRAADECLGALARPT